MKSEVRVRSEFMRLIMIPVSATPSAISMTRFTWGFPNVNLKCLDITEKYLRRG